MLIDGEVVTRMPAAQRTVAVVFQGFALFPHLTVAGNIGFGLAVRGVGRRETERRVREAAATVGCEDLLSRFPAQVSWGEQQRVAFARALVRNPRVFLLDEPLSNLDARLRVSMRDEVRGLQARTGATMLYVTHDQFEALTLGSRVAVLHEGVVQQFGTPDEVYERPANRFVATFMGTPEMNILSAVIRGDGIEAAGLRIGIPTGVDLGAPDALEVGIRPEHLRIGPVGGAATASVERVERAGADTFVYLDASGTRLVARAREGIRPTSGERVGITPEEAHVYLFDADSGERRWGGA